MTNYYVDPAGNDSHTGLSPESATAWLTLQYAANNTVAGDTIHVAAGTYDQTSNINGYLYSAHNGSAGNPISWVSTTIGGAKVTNGNTGAAPVFVWYNSGNYVNITGFDISGSGTNIAIALENIGTNVNIDRCLCHDVPAPAPGSFPGAGILHAITATACSVTRCKVYNIGYAGGANNQTQGIYWSGGGGGTCQNNIVYGNPGWGIHLWHNASGVVVTNNLCFNNTSGGIVNGADGGSANTNTLVANNICYNNGGYGLREASATGGTVVTPTYTNNCFFGNTLGASGLITSGASVVNSVITDPLLVNYQANGSGDYHLTASSPCIIDGPKVGMPATDFDGNNRNAYSPCIGPYQFQTTIHLPTDGFGIYESVATLSNSAVYQPRLDKIAAAGFKLVLNYNTINGTIADATAYINYAASKGLKVIVPLDDPRIWKTLTYPTIYPDMYASSGNAATPILFAQYIVNQLKGLAGVWGWYVADEALVVDHATFAPYAAAIRAADSTHPRLIMQSAQPGDNNNFYTNTTPYSADCEVGGDDRYALGDAEAWASVATVASGIQTTCNSLGISSAMTLQAFSWQQVGPSTRCSPWPACAPWPSVSQLLQQCNAACSNMQARLILWYSFGDVLSVNAPPTYLADLASVITATYGPTFSMASL